MKFLKFFGFRQRDSIDVEAKSAFETYVAGVVALAKAVESIASVIVEHQSAIEELRENQRIIIDAIESAKGYTHKRPETKVN